MSGAYNSDQYGYGQQADQQGYGMMNQQDDQGFFQSNYGGWDDQQPQQGYEGNAQDQGGYGRFVSYSIRNLQA